MAQSTKCDFRRNIAARPVSSKCDFLRAAPSSKCDFLRAAPSSKCDFLRAASSKCDFRMLEFRAAAASKCDWRLNLGALAARGVTNRLQQLDVRIASQRLRVASDKCDFRVTLSPTGAARTSTAAAIRSDKCDFNLAVLGTAGKRSALGVIGTRMSSDKCDFNLRLDLGSQANPILRVNAVASAKCDFRIRSVEVLENGNWRKIG